MFIFQFAWVKKTNRWIQFWHYEKTFILYIAHWIQQPIPKLWNYKCLRFGLGYFLEVKRRHLYFSLDPTTNSETMKLQIPSSWSWFLFRSRKTTFLFLTGSNNQLRNYDNTFILLTGSNNQFRIYKIIFILFIRSNNQFQNHSTTVIFVYLQKFRAYFRNFF